MISLAEDRLSWKAQFFFFFFLEIQEMENSDEVSGASSTGRVMETIRMMRVPRKMMQRRELL